MTPAHSVLAIDFISGDARGTISPSALFAYFVLAGPPSAAAKYFEAQERKDIKRAALKQEKKL